MAAESVFTALNAVALLGWLALAFAPAPWRYRLALGVAVVLLAGYYVAQVFPALGGVDFMAFTTLEGIMALQGSPAAALVGWAHYLAFDLVAGCVIARDAEVNALSRWAMLPVLLATFMLGPVGWLAYVVLRFALRRRWQWSAFGGGR